MKYTYAAIFALMLICCQKRKLVTYEEGLENCNKIQEEKKKDNPNGLFFVSADCLIGSRIPEFETTSIEGEKISNELLKGKVSIINFWFISCAPCVAEIPGFNAIVEKFGKDHVNYIAIGRDDKKEIQEFLHKHPWGFKHIANGNEIITNDFKIRWGFPTTFLLDKNAKIVLALSGGKSDSTAVQEIQNKLIPIIERELN
jgi:peroxiredoxin